MVKCALHMHVCDCDCPEFRDEIPLRRGECKTRENSNFLKKGKNRNFGKNLKIF